MTPHEIALKAIADVNLALRALIPHVGKLAVEVIYEDIERLALIRRHVNSMADDFTAQNNA